MEVPHPFNQDQRGDNKVIHCNEAALARNVLQATEREAFSILISGANIIAGQIIAEVIFTILFPLNCQRKDVGYIIYQN